MCINNYTINWEKLGCRIILTVWLQLPRKKKQQISAFICIQEKRLNANAPKHHQQLSMNSPFTFHSLEFYTLQMTDIIIRKTQSLQTPKTAVKNYHKATPWIIYEGIKN